MKAILISLSVALLMVGCEESSTPSDPVDSPKAIDLDDNETRDKIVAGAIDEDKLKGRGKEDPYFYAPNQLMPYTGWARRMHDNGQILGLLQYKGGLYHGLSTFWHENGQKKNETTLKYSNYHGLEISWFENGQKSEEANWNEGDLMSVDVWKPNGEKCPVSNVVNGNGVRVWYNVDGTERGRRTYKDGH